MIGLNQPVPGGVGQICWGQAAQVDLAIILSKKIMYNRYVFSYVDTAKIHDASASW